MKLLVVLAVLFGVGASSESIEGSGIISPEKGHPRSRVAGGWVASPNQIPYQGYINTTYYVCGAVLIKPNWALTSAVCILRVSIVHVYFGSTSVNHLPVKRRAYVIKVHPDFNKSLLHHNIAILGFDAVPIGANIQPIRIADSNQGSFVSRTSTVSGFGGTYEGEEEVYLLRYANLTVISNEACKAIYAPKYIIDSTLCAIGQATRPQGVCMGDSGGPLIVGDPFGPLLIGVVSFWSKVGCDVHYPSGFTRINKYNNWIKGITAVQPKIEGHGL